ncbi:hypothetical protein GCM10011390_18920 [Aureimonas endophytica]|uniref:Uncharacterized protein n=1 Tax=Aureimonas endophytica TaxID=2027858 RepID=A0A916ZJW4_9HYPH|nr:hypothetical protein [Aureimonas endophytica]GGE00309.1 hypothetical protein GCM10011390_18920 [Aureimonas endophytica]
MSFEDRPDGIVWRNSWDEDRFGDDPAIGNPFTGEQATMAARWDVRTWWREMARRYGLTENESMIAVELWAEAVGLGRWTNYSRSDEHYAKFPKSVFYTKRLICSGVDGLERKGLVWNWRQVPYGFGWQSAVKATPELVAMVQAVIDAIGRPYPARPKSVLVLRDADGKPMPIRETGETRRMTVDLEDYNNLLRSSTVDGEHATCVRRVFNETIKQGGRHYCIGLSYQRKPFFERARMMINGRSVVEYDYGSQHPCLLYAMAGLPIPEDAYDLEWWDRDLQKVAFLVMINCSDPDVALHSIAGKPAMGKVAEPGSEEALRVASALYAELADRHRAIAHMFSTGIGRVLQRKDSDMMAEVLREMTKAKRLALPVFDSCIVEEADGDLLADVMRRVAIRAKVEGIRIEKVVPKKDSSVTEDFDEFPVQEGRAAETSRLMPASSLPSSSLSSSPFQDQALELKAASRRAVGEALRTEAEGRPPLPESFLSVSDASAEAPTVDSVLDPSGYAILVESPTGSPDVEPHDHSSFRSKSHSLPWNRSSILASLDLLRHDRAVAAARAVAGPAVSPDLDWTATVGFGLAQNTDRGSCWTWSQPGRRECVVHLVNAAAETVLAVVDQAAAGRVVEAYLRSLSGSGPRLRIDVSYAGRYDLGVSPEENSFRFEPVTDVLRRPSLVPGAPDVEDDEPPFVTDEAWFDDEDLPLAA